MVRRGPGFVRREALRKKSVCGEAGSDVQAHDADVDDECEGNAYSSELLIGTVEQNTAAERAHSELCREEGDIAGIEKRGHKLIGLGSRSRTHPADRNDSIDQIQEKEDRNRTQKFQVVSSRSMSFNIAFKLPNPDK